MKVKKFLFICLNVLIGLVFIVSAISKMPSIEQFGWTIVETTFFNWTAAEWFARILIGLEFFLGILFLFQLRIRKIAGPISLMVLSIFTIYLFLVLNQYGASQNCGCFGELIPMTPLESIIKNIVLIAMILVAIGGIFEFEFPYIKILLVCIFLISIIIPFIIVPPESIYIYEKEANLNKPIALSLLYNSKINKAPDTELRQGKHIISFMSMTCTFCRKAAKRLRIMKQKHPKLPFYIILNGDIKKLDEFMNDTKVDNIPISIFNGAEQFTIMNDGSTLPTIKWVQDTTVVRESNYLTLDEYEILEWMK